MKQYVQLDSNDDDDNVSGGRGLDRRTADRMHLVTKNQNQKTKETTICI